MELSEVCFLGRRPDVHRVTDSIGTEPYRILNGGVYRRERLRVGWDVGLAVELEN
jgi:hypothetical protein